MIEKLLENWLDSASERSYQAVFVQMLAAEGYTVLHSTRHCLLEFGKDILAVSPDGVGCAFQLKGDPRGRMTIGHFRSEIQGQLLQLTSQTPSYPGFPTGVHRSYLVSNGQFDEEVQIAVAQMNSGYIPSKIELWPRGKLLELCNRHGASLWPSELRDNRALLELYLAPPHAQLPAATLTDVLESVLHLGEADTPLSRNELERATTSAAWLTGISTSVFAEADNHQAVIHAWCYCCAALISAETRYSSVEVKTLRATLALAEASLLDALTALWNEVRQKDKLVQGDPLTDSLVYGWRISNLYGMLTSLAIANEGSELLNAESSEALVSWLKSSRYQPLLWGEAAVANLAPWLVWLRKADATARVDREIEGIAQMIIHGNQAESLLALANPYYEYEDVLRHYLRHPQVRRANNLERETIAGSSFTAELLLHLVVRTNVKTSCRALWPDFSKLVHRRFVMEHPWHFGLRRAPGGVEESRVYPLTYSWQQLKTDALTGDGTFTIPDYFASKPWFLAMWWQVAPNRLDRDSLRTFVDALIPGWGT
ncbi:hypothetical protein GALL_35220 [mine drainage metagenome]|uniref:Uncharacterized protein n=1 Tax=mine drainage metagenome TaxID=410659 RepID=A0A1J5T566_9ZZZZ